MKRQKLNISDYRQINESAWDQMAREQNRLAKPARKQDFEDPLGTVDGSGWLGGDVSGKTVLCLAAGGGRQGPIYAAAGGIVTVVDISQEMLELDRKVAAEKNFSIRTVKASMDALNEIGDAEYDIVIHPVSTCYVESIEKVFAEVARVTRPQGTYISQHKTPTSLQVQTQSTAGYQIQVPYYRQQPLPPTQTRNLVREPGTYEFIHRWEQIVGGMCRAGFVIEDLTEPFHADPETPPGSFEHRSQFVAPYVRIKARRLGKSESRIVLS